MWEGRASEPQTREYPYHLQAPCNAASSVDE
jgi:hypothetical protein